MTDNEAGHNHQAAGESPPNTDEYAAIDLGSNSFHMVVARYGANTLTTVDRVREMVRLGSGLDNKNRLADKVAERALDCLKRFGERLRGIKGENVRIVGTNALRKARNSAQFIEQAEIVLGFPIDIISGIEEARLIYLGVSETLKENLGLRLVIDIGGGSTELIIGDVTTPMHLASLDMGCVSSSEKFFTGGKITASRMRQAILAASIELEPHVAKFKQLEWIDVIGTSGTVRAIERVVRESGFSEGGITPTALERLLMEIVDAGHVDHLNPAGLGEHRRPVFAGGAAVMTAIFRSLGIRHMRISDGSLREGVLADLIGRSKEHDTRSETVRDLMKRHHIDQNQAKRVRDLATYLFRQVKDDWDLKRRHKLVMQWAAQLHEIGLMIAHSQHHRHGAYILEHMDLAGFSRQEQEVLSILVRLHRRKLSIQTLERFKPEKMTLMKRLIILLRLAVLFNRRRSEEQPPEIRMSVDEDEIQLMLNAQWLKQHPLTQADLEQEQLWLEGSGVRLQIPD